MSGQETGPGGHHSGREIMGSLGSYLVTVWLRKKRVFSGLLLLEVPLEILNLLKPAASIPRLKMQGRESYRHHFCNLVWGPTAKTKRTSRITRSFHRIPKKASFSSYMQDHRETPSNKKELSKLQFRDIRSIVTQRRTLQSLFLLSGWQLNIIWST